MSRSLSNRAALIHAFLFTEGGSLSWKRLSQLLGCDEAAARDAAGELSVFLEGSGLSIISTDREATLATASSVAASIKSAFDRQTQRDIGEAGLEVLAILLYRGPSTRAEIDYIRGVNTSSTIRTLLSRGLIERASEQAREFMYFPTTELLSYLGVSNASELAEYATIRSELAAFEDSKTPFISYAAAAGTGADTDEQAA